MGRSRSILKDKTKEELVDTKTNLTNLYTLLNFDQRILEENLLIFSNLAFPDHLKPF